MPNDEVCQPIVDEIVESELGIAILDEDACAPQALICRVYDGTWAHDGTVSYC